jgi:SAM-dependent methyltransferase
VDEVAIEMVAKAARRGVLDLADHFDWDTHANQSRGRVFNWMRRAVKPVLRQGRRALERRRNGEMWGIDGEFVAERHHRAYGSPWCVGREQFDYFIQRGLKRSDFVGDLGCGSLRLGVWMITYLDVGRYFGIDAHRKSLEAAVQYEIPLHGLEHKHPRLLLDGDFSLDHFQVLFDWVVAFSLFIHLEDTACRRALSKIASVLAPGGRVVVNNDLPVETEELEKDYGLVVSHRGEYPCRFLSQGSGWIELSRKTPASM